MAGGKASKAAGHAPAPEGSDNNTRLAFLESRVEPLITATANIAARYGGNVQLAPLNAEEDLVDCEIRILNEIAQLPDVQLDRIQKIAEAVVGYGIDLAEGLDPIEQAIAIIGRAREMSLGLAEAVVEGEHDVREGEGPFEAAVRILSAPSAGASDGELAAIKRAEDVEAALKGASAKIVTLENAIRELGDAEKRPGFLRRLLGRGGDDVAADEPPVARDPVECGPTFGTATVEELREKLGGEHDLELVLSDGQRELIEFRPYPLALGDLVRHGAGYMVSKPIPVAGGEADIEVAGAALLCDGEQLDFCPFDRPKVIAAGMQYQFSMTFVFGHGGGAYGRK
jgi:hypothetical protein